MLWIKNISQLFYPTLCCGCNEPILHQTDILCSNCLLSLSFFPKTDEGNNEMKRRLYGKLSVNHCLSLLAFTDKSITQKLLHQLKYKNQSHISKFMGILAIQHLYPHEIFRQAECIVPIPLHPSKEKKRGYNQLDGFGTYLSEKFGIPYHKDFLIKTKKSDTQTRKNIIERAENKNEFTINPYYSNMKSQHILLIDDVMTTGSTLEIAGNCIRKNSSHQISILTMACTR